MYTLAGKHTHEHRTAQYMCVATQVGQRQSHPRLRSAFDAKRGGKGAASPSWGSIASHRKLSDHTNALGSMNGIVAPNLERAARLGGVDDPYCERAQRLLGGALHATARTINTKHKHNQSTPVNPAVHYRAFDQRYVASGSCDSRRPSSSRRPSVAKTTGDDDVPRASWWR